MNLQPAQSPYTPAGAGMPPSGTPPMLGQQNPVTANSPPAQGGLSVLGNPIAQQLQAQGRGEDTMLVHMTPAEVNSLQGLAMATGGSLTINPSTGLPEAGWLGKLLPTILGAIATPLTGGLINPLTASALIGAGTGIATGSLGKGLMAGLQAYGGAALGSAAGLNAGSFGIGKAAQAASTALPSAAATAAPAATAPAAAAATPSAFSVPIGGGPMPLNAIANTAQQAATNAPGFFGRFAEAARAGLPAGTPGIVAKAAPAVAGLGVLSGVSGAMTPSGMPTSSGQIDNSYQGPYTAQQRKPTFAADTSEILGSSKERDYFSVDTPEIYNMQGQVVQPGSSTAPGTPILQSYLLPTPKKKKGTPMYGFRSSPYMTPPEDYAKGGEVELADGAFVVDARTVSEIGNGSSNAGHELLARLGGRPVRGPGDGVSDSVPARIGRDQPARVARDEVIFSPEAVKRLGKGDQKKGAEKLYALMEKAHKARKKSERGKDTKLRKGLA
jgi:hypothetical protein